MNQQAKWGEQLLHQSIRHSRVWESMLTIGMTLSTTHTTMAWQSITKKTLSSIGIILPHAQGGETAAINCGIGHLTALPLWVLISAHWENLWRELHNLSCRERIFQTPRLPSVKTQRTYNFSRKRDSSRITLLCSRLIRATVMRRRYQWPDRTSRQ